MQLPYLEYAAHQIVLYTFERTDSDCSVEVVEFVSVDDQFLAVIASVCLAWEGQGLHEMLQSGTTRGWVGSINWGFEIWRRGFGNGLVQRNAAGEGHCVCFREGWVWKWWV